MFLYVHVESNLVTNILQYVSLYTKNIFQHVYLSVQVFPYHIILEVGMLGQRVYQSAQVPNSKNLKTTKAYFLLMQHIPAELCYSSGSKADRTATISKIASHHGRRKAFSGCYIDDSELWLGSGTQLITVQCISQHQSRG